MRYPKVLHWPSLLLMLCLASSVLAEEEKVAATKPDAAKPTSDIVKGVEARAVNKTAATSQPTSAPSEAEKIIRLDKGIADTEKELAELKASLEDPDSEYAQAKREFAELDKQLKERDKAIAEAAKPSEGTSPSTSTQPVQSRPADTTELENLRKQWQLAKERFDLVIQEDAANKKKMETLETKLQQDREAMARLQNPAEVAASQPAGEFAGTATGTPAGATAQAAAHGRASSPAGATPAPQAAPAATPPAASPTAVVAPAPAPVGSTATASPTAEAAPAKPPKPVSEELVKAQEKAQATEAQAQQAQQEVQSVTERVETLRKNIQTERELLNTARKKTANAQETQTALREQLRQRSSEGAPAAELNELWDKVAKARARASEAEAEVNQQVDRLDELQNDLQALQAEQIDALGKAKQAQQKVDAAQKEVERLENPFSPHNMLKWVFYHGPRLLGIVVTMFILLSLARVAEGRLSKIIAGRSDHGDRLEREARATTLASVFRSAMSVVVITGGVLMMLAEIEIDIVPLLGGAAVVGLAVAFGAQSLIKDYFYGFIILLENQYTINDVIRIGDTAGLVERITLRMTVLRDLEGVVHFIPHGEANKVSNMTHGWSRALFDVGVAYKENVDRVIEVLLDLARELRKDPQFAPVILDDAEMLGVDNLGDSAVVIKFIIKTRPLKQWMVKREMLRRIKNRFDELGIEIPFPHRTVYHRYEGSEPMLPGVHPRGGEPPADRHHPAES